MISFILIPFSIEAIFLKGVVTYSTVHKWCHLVCISTIVKSLSLFWDKTRHSSKWLVKMDICCCVRFELVGIKNVVLFSDRIWFLSYTVYKTFWEQNCCVPNMDEKQLMVINEIRKPHDHHKRAEEWVRYYLKQVACFQTKQNYSETLDRELAEGHLKTRSLCLSLCKWKSIWVQESHQSLKGFKKHGSDDAMCSSALLTLLLLHLGSWAGI